MKIRLIQEFGAQAGRQLPFDKDRVRIGRAPDNDVVFDANIDLDSSKNHCELVLERGVWYVTDLASRNGTFVNGNRVQRQPLNPGDVIECGRGGPRLRVEMAPPTPAAMPFGVGVMPGAGVMPPPNPATVAMAMPPPAFGAPMHSPPMPMPGGMPAGMPPGMPPGMPMGMPPGPPPMMGAPPSSPGAPSVGQAIAAGLPQNAQVGKRTVALMIDQALMQHTKRSGSSTTGLKVAFGLLATLVVVALGAGAWVLYDRQDNNHSNNGTSGTQGGPDPSTAGARLAAANEANIYLLAMVQNGQRVRGFCTGFSVGQNLVATNAHCINVATTEINRGYQLVVLRNKSMGQSIAARPVYADARFQNNQMSRGGSGYDVGLVQTAAPLASWVRLASDAELQGLHEGDAIFVYGFPGMTMNERSPVATITLGLLNRLTDFFDSVGTPATTQKLQHSAQTSGGSSGSPIFLPSGSVIGVNAGSLSDEERQIVIDPNNGQRREVEVNRGSNFKYGMRADLIRQAMAAVGVQSP